MFRIYLFLTAGRRLAKVRFRCAADPAGDFAGFAVRGQPAGRQHHAVRDASAVHLRQIQGTPFVSWNIAIVSFFWRICSHSTNFRIESIDLDRRSVSLLLFQYEETIDFSNIKGITQADADKFKIESLAAANKNIKSDLDRLREANMPASTIYIYILKPRLSFNHFSQTKPLCSSLNHIFKFFFVLFVIAFHPIICSSFAFFQLQNRFVLQFRQ